MKPHPSDTPLPTRNAAIRRVCAVTMQSTLRAAVLCAAVSAAGCVAERRDGEDDPVKVGDRVPEFAVTDVSSGARLRFAHSDFEGLRSVIVFFSSECPDCRRELPIVHRAWLGLREHADFRFIAIARQPSVEDAQSYWTSVSADKPSFEGMPWWFDEGGTAFRTFAARSIPRMYLIDSTGRVASVVVERFDLGDGDIVRLVEELE